jgi:hypothetical protein
MKKYQISKVLHRDLSSPFRYLHPNDFVTNEPINLVPNQINGYLSGTIPYAIDTSNNQVLYSLQLDLKNSISSSFLYHYQRHNTKYLLSIPIQQGNLHSLERFTYPVFIFSTGRCGSTLFSKLASEQGQLTISEPDFYTQLALHNLAPVSKDLRSFLHNHLTLDLLKGFHNQLNTIQPFIKLRAECCQSANIFIKKDNQKTIFISRPFESWASSMIKHFNRPNLNPKILVNFYVSCIKALDFLNSNSDCTHIRYDQLISGTPSDLTLLSNAIGSSISIEKFNNVLNVDSQIDSTLSRLNSVKNQIDLKKLNATIDLFNEVKPSALLKKFDI